MLLTVVLYSNFSYLLLLSLLFQVPIPLQIQNIIHILNSKLHILVQASNFLPGKIKSAFNSLQKSQFHLEKLKTFWAHSVQAMRHLPIFLPGRFYQHNRTPNILKIYLSINRVPTGLGLDILSQLSTRNNTFYNVCKTLPGLYRKSFYKHQALYKTNLISNLISRTWVICSHFTMLKLLTIIGDQSFAGYSHGSRIPAFTDYDSWMHPQMLTTPTLRHGINLVFIGRKEKKKKSTERVKRLIHDHIVAQQAQLSQRPLATSPAP